MAEKIEIETKYVDTLLLSEAELKKYNQYIQKISQEIAKMNKYLSTAKSALTCSDATEFKSGYPVGQKAITNMTSVIDILISLKSDLNKLVKSGETFYTTASKLVKK